MLIVIFSLVLAAFVVMLITGPLRAAQAAGDPAGEGSEAESARREAFIEDSRSAELEAARESKYREIRDAELDYRTGKLSEEDYAAIDGQLRGEALEILNELETLGVHAEEDDAPAERAGS
jgi:hypothetical protein